MTNGRGPPPPVASNFANASTSDAKSVPALPKKTSMPRSFRSCRYASATVSADRILVVMGRYSTPTDSRRTRMDAEGGYHRQAGELVINLNTAKQEDPMFRAARRLVPVVLLAALMTLGGAADAGAQTGEAVIAWHVTIAPSWFDPSTAPAQITPFGILYALHDSVVRATYGTRIGPGLAEAWSESPDGLVYEFRLRRNLKFHNGDPVTAEDVKFSFDRYKGAAASELKSRVEAVEVVNPLTVRFRLRAPWPDFMTFYGTTVSGAGLVVPKKY